MSLGRAISWLLPFGLLIYAVVSIPLRLLSEEGWPRYRMLAAQLARTTSENAELEREIERLNREVKALSHDPVAVERIARDELGLMRDDELLFQFTPDESTFLTNRR